jgi:hypothetical protein
VKRLQAFVLRGNLLQVSTSKGSLLTNITHFRGVVLYYLPPYSPDLNPIEEAFSYVKAYLRRHGHIFRVAVEAKNDWAVHSFLYTALGTITSEHACEWMGHSGYM